MLLLIAELLDTILELLLVPPEDAWLDVEALSEPEPPLPPHALNNVSSAGMQSFVNETQLRLSAHDIRDSG